MTCAKCSSCSSGSCSAPCWRGEHGVERRSRSHPRARSPSYTPRVIRRVLDQLVLRIAKIATRGFYRKVETAGFDRLDSRRPTLVVANHFNGFADPVLVVSALGRLPRFLAKATLWKVILVRPPPRRGGR